MNNYNSNAVKKQKTHRPLGDERKKTFALLLMAIKNFSDAEIASFFGTTRQNLDAHAARTQKGDHE